MVECFPLHTVDNLSFFKNRIFYADFALHALCCKYKVHIQHCFHNFIHSSGTSIVTVDVLDQVYSEFVDIKQVLLFILPISTGRRLHLTAVK